MMWICSINNINNINNQRQRQLLLLLLSLLFVLFTAVRGFVIENTFTTASIRRIEMRRCNQHQHRHRHLHSKQSSEEQQQLKQLQDAKSKLDIKGVTLKMAFDTNYAVADSSENKSERFTSPESLDMVHKLRRWSDAVLVGRSTVQRDDCTLTVRRVSLIPPPSLLVPQDSDSDSDGDSNGSTNHQQTQQQSQPVRVVIDPSLKILDDEYDYAMFNDGHQALIYHSNHEKNLEKVQTYHASISSTSSSPSSSSKHVVQFIGLPSQEIRNDNGISTYTLSVKDILNNLSVTHNIHHVMVEGGPATAIQFLKQNLVERAIMVRAPVTFIEPVSSFMCDEMLVTANLQLVQSCYCGTDVIEYWTRDGQPWPTCTLVDNDDDDDDDVDVDDNDKVFDNEIWPY